MEQHSESTCRGRSQCKPHASHTAARLIATPRIPFCSATPGLSRLSRYQSEQSDALQGLCHVLFQLAHLLICWCAYRVPGSRSSASAMWGAFAISTPKRLPLSLALFNAQASALQSIRREDTEAFTLFHFLIAALPHSTLHGSSRDCAVSSAVALSLALAHAMLRAGVDRHLELV